MNIWYDYIDLKTNYIWKNEEFVQKINEYKKKSKNLPPSSHLVLILSTWIRLFRKWSYDIFKYLDIFLNYTTEIFTEKDIQDALKIA